MLNRPKPLVLLILEGFGYSAEQENNAMANTLCRDQLQNDYPMTLLDCSGRSVGFPMSKWVIQKLGKFISERVC